MSTLTRSTKALKGNILKTTRFANSYIPSSNNALASTLSSSVLRSSSRLSTNVENRYLHYPRPSYNAAAIPFDFEKVMDVSSKLLKERIIMLTGTVDEQMSDWVITRLLLLESQNPEKQINLYINSPGGYVTAGLAIYDTMQFIKSPISTVCLGQACSMGAFLLLSGTPGLRAALPNATIMMHDVGGGYSGQLPDVRVAAQQLMSLSDRMANLAVKHTKMSLDKYKQMIDRDYFMYPEEAIKHGVIDQILVKPTPVTVSPLSTTSSTPSV